jgi:N6-L-threonylcarbamoyladenine synthase
VLNVVSAPAWQPADAADLAAEFQDAVVDVLCAKALQAVRQTGLSRLVVAGGVGANRRLRERLDADARRCGWTVFYPEPELCTDNGVMIAFAGACRLAAGQAGKGSGAVRVFPRWPLAELRAPGQTTG